MSAEIGDRLRDVRKRRGMSQRELSQQSGVSLSLIRKLEQGERSDTRLETVHMLASALRVSTTRLITSHIEEAADPTVIRSWEPLHRALAGRTTTDDLAEAPTVDGVTQAVDGAMRLFSSNQFAKLGTVLPPLLRDTETLAALDHRGRAPHMRVLQLVAWLLVQTRQFASAELVLERSLDGAVDQLQGAATINTQCWSLLRQGRLSESRELALRWADDTEPRLSRATAGDLSTWGWMLLRVSASAVRDNRPGEAADALRLAKSAATALGQQHETVDHLRSFGPLTVKLKRAENAMIVQKPDHVLSLAEQIPVNVAGLTPSDVNRHRLDVANAYAHTRQYTKSVETLLDIQHAAPEWLSNQRYARDILGSVIKRRRTLTPEMRSLAAAVHLPI
ncbi:helix-turn-helix domain-containing protein [Streptomyces sp. NPDC059853]|uniref:helix-turn-helix domain-containing protein n=1 Tax=Streptomyces sp. NPDC059853 TaxID=3346973 RepID=UPI003646CCA5